MQKAQDYRSRIPELDAMKVFDELSGARRSIKLTMGKMVARYQLKSKKAEGFTPKEDEAVDQVLGQLRNTLMLLDDILEHRAAKVLKLLA